MLLECACEKQSTRLWVLCLAVIIAVVGQKYGAEVEAIDWERAKRYD